MSLVQGTSPNFPADDSTSAEEPQAVELRPLRVWPVVLLLIGMLVTRLLPSLVTDGPPMLWMSAAFGPVLCGLVMLVWWVLISRANWRERILGFVGLIVGAVVVTLFLDPTMQGPGMMILTLPIGFAAFGIGAVLVSRWLSIRRTVLALLLGWIGFSSTLTLRAEGVWGDFGFGLDWRWVPTAEERLLADVKNREAVAIGDMETDKIDAALANPEWPAFRGANRDGKYLGAPIDTDWKTNPPELLWKISVGPAWSSFVVAGDLLFTQEQRGTEEVVVCYDANRGAEVWTRAFEARFEDPLGGPGPRSTPTLSGDGLYVMGASGVVAKLEPKSGSVVWQRDLKKDAGREPPMWGFSSSPLVIDNRVIVYAGAGGDKGLLAYDTSTGEPVWSATSGPQSYASPQLGSFSGQNLIMMLSDLGLDLLEPETGKIAYSYAWPFEGYRAVQPQWLDNEMLIVPTGMGAGTRRVKLTKTPEGFSSEEVWTTRELKPDFNDYVIHNGYLYGFDQGIFTCVELEEGVRAWRGGRYGKGQVLLLAQSDALIVMSEQGDVVLLRADSEERVELGSFTPFDAKTWNHPVVVGDRLFIRNSEEAACYRLKMAAPDNVVMPLIPPGDAGIPRPAAAPLGGRP